MHESCREKVEDVSSRAHWNRRFFADLITLLSISSIDVPDFGVSYRIEGATSADVVGELSIQTIAYKHVAVQHGLEWLLII